MAHPYHSIYDSRIIVEEVTKNSKSYRVVRSVIIKVVFWILYGNYKNEHTIFQATYTYIKTLKDIKIKWGHKKDS